MTKKKTYSIPHCPKIGDVVLLTRDVEPHQYYGVVTDYVDEYIDPTVCEVEWFDGLRSQEYVHNLEVQNG
tara:strand:- start:495 stop:704 length:210 start_codon:yes stop_codon:yes gene_type:complete